MGTIGPWSFLASQTIAEYLNVETNVSQWAPEGRSIHKMFVKILCAHSEDLTVFVKDHIAAVCFRKLTCPPAKQSRHSDGLQMKRRGWK